MGKKPSLAAWWAATWVAALAAAASTGCTAITHIDVCERDGAVERELNTRTEGRQYLETPRSVSALPAGGGLVVFTSAASAAPDELRTEVRGVLVTQDGAPLPTCGEPDGETTYAPRAGEGAQEIFIQPSIVPPATDQGLGLLAYSMDDGATMQVYVQQIDAAACQAGSTGQVQVSLEQGPPCVYLRDETAVAEGLDMGCAANPVAVRLSETDYVVLWVELRIEGRASTMRVMARVLRVNYVAVEFLATEPSRAGEPVEIGDSSWLISEATAVGLPGGRFALLWHEDDAGILRTLVQLFDDRLAPLSERRVLSEAPGDAPDRVGLDAAFDGERVLAAWIERDAAGMPRATAALLSADAAPLGGAFRLGTAPAGEESRVDVVARRGGGFVAAWTESGVAGRGDGSGSSLRARALDRDGATLFANRACDQTDFQLNQATGGDQLTPSLAELVDGSILAAWTDAGQNGVDRSLESIRAVSFSPYELFPLEEER